MNVLPDPQEREVLHFHLARSLPYRKRLMIAAVFFFIGIVLEVFLSFPIGMVGVAFLFVGSLITTSAGFTNKPLQTAQPGFWKSTDIDRLDQILELSRKSAKWDQTALDVSNVLGFFALAAVGLLVLGAAIVAETLIRGGFFLVVASGIAIYLPIWFTGLRLGHSNKKIVQKIKVMKDVIEYYKTIAVEGERLEASVFFSGNEDNATPEDVKFQITWEGATEEFYGLQCQVNLNDVQGKSYPYCYFVIVAKRDLKIFFASSGARTDLSTTIEEKVQSDVNVIVVRGYTTKTSGYHTLPSQCRELFWQALGIARAVARQYPRS